MCGDRVEITGMPQLFFKQWSKLSQDAPGRHMVGSGTHRANKRVFPDHSFHGPLQGSTVHPLPSSAGRSSPWLWDRCKKARSPLALLKGTGCSPKGKPRSPFTMLLELPGSKRATCYVYVLLFDIFKPSPPRSALVFMSFYTSLKGIDIMQDQGVVGKANTF